MYDLIWKDGVYGCRGERAPSLATCGIYTTSNKKPSETHTPG